MIGLANPRLIEFAREHRGFSQSHLAKSTSMSQGFISKIENGDANPSPDFLRKLSEVLGFPVEFFYERENIYPPGVHLFRKFKSVTKSSLTRITTTVNLYRITCQRLLKSLDIPDNKLKLIESEDVKEAAQAARFALGYDPERPIRNLVTACENAGILVIFTELLDRKVSGLSISTDNGVPIIIINSTMPSDRIVFTIAHEIGHLILHTVPTEAVEQEADDFASEFLLPASAVRSQLRQLTLPKLAQLKRHWRVSMQAILMRATRLGTITENQARYLWVCLKSNYKNQEPPELNFPIEPPALIREILDFHFDELDYTVPSLARAMRLEEKDFLELYSYFIKNTPFLRLLD